MALDWLFGRSQDKESRRRGVRKGGARHKDPRTETQLLQRSVSPAPPADLSPPVSSSPSPATPPLRREVQVAVPQPAPVAPPAATPPSFSSMRPASSSTSPDDDIHATRVVGARATPVVGVLVGTGGVLEGQAFIVRDGENRIGRLPGIEIALPQADDRISREHALLIHREGAFGVKALRPDNPTWVNGEAVREGAALSDGDELRVGQSTFRFRVV